MREKRSIEGFFDEYLKVYQEEVEIQSRFKKFLASTESNDLYNRKNFGGHITASAFIVNQTLDKILLIEHKILKRWLQPGGHVEPKDASLLEASLREVEEEVNIKSNALKLISPTGAEKVPFDIDSHFIPANPSKNEEGHYHHDFRYLFKYEGMEKLNINQVEVSDWKWVDFSDLNKDCTFQIVMDKLRLLDNRASLHPINTTT